MITCPLPTELEDVPAVDCAVQFDQIVKMVFQRKQASAPFTTTTIKVLATWTPLLTAADATKVVPSPIFAELVIPQSEPLVSGGNDNTTFNGIPVYNGEGTVGVTAQISNLPAAVKKAMKALTPYSLASSVGLSDLVVFFVNRNGDIIHNNGAGFPIYNFRIGSTGSEGLNAPNKNQIGFSLLPHWDDEAVMTTPSFDALTSLVP